jgi:hypothetical protein
VKFNDRIEKTDLGWVTAWDEQACSYKIAAPPKERWCGSSCGIGGARAVMDCFWDSPELIGVLWAIPHGVHRASALDQATVVPE